MIDMTEERKKVADMLKKRYILAITIIACMLIFSQLIVQYNISSEEDKARVINIAGRQRMLSQRITKDIMGLYISEDYRDRKNYLNELNLSLEIWEQSHQGLLHGDSKMKLLGNNSMVIQNMFDSINPNFLNILEAAKNVKNLSINGSKQEDLLPYLKIIQGNEPDFLQGMDKIVFQYTRDSDEKVAFFKELEMILLAVALITLLLEIIFIFRPSRLEVTRVMKNLEESYKNIKNIFQTAPTPMILFSEKEFKILRVNTAAKDFFLKSGKNIEIRNILEENRKDVNGILNDLKIEGNIKNKEINLKINEYEKIVLLISACSLNFEEEDTILVGFSDITIQKKSQEELYLQATMDEMTQILNKRTGLNLLEEKINKNEKFAVVFVDIDGLKQVNDTYGHQEGDSYIKNVVDKIKESLYPTDFLFRYGGDEIVIIINAHDIGCIKRAKNIITKINLVPKDEAKQYKMLVSYGIAEYDNIKKETVEELLARADSEMYINKRMNKEGRIIN